MFLIDKSYWEVKITKNKGKGVFANKEIKKGTVIGDYTGKLIPIEKIDFEKERKTMYLMYYSDEFGIYPDLGKPGIHLLNHSCSPNCFVFKFKDRTLIFALRNIKTGEELTIHYLLPSKISKKTCPHKCFCESHNCTGSMHLSEEKYQKWQQLQNKYFNNHLPAKKLNKNMLRPLTNYPEVIKNKFINEAQQFLQE